MTEEVSSSLKMPHFTAAEVAAELRVSVNLVRRIAHQHGIGIKVGGYRFTEADVEAIKETRRPKPVEVVRRRRRRRY